MRQKGLISLKIGVNVASLCNGGETIDKLHRFLYRIFLLEKKSALMKTDNLIINDKCNSFLMMIATNLCTMSYNELVIVFYEQNCIYIHLSPLHLRF